MTFRTLFAVSIFWTTITASAQPKADIIIFNGKIHTMDDQKRIFQAVAIIANKVLAVGSNVMVFKTKNKQTTFIDVQGKTVIPGFFDSHLHVIRGGRFYNAELRC